MDEIYYHCQCCLNRRVRLYMASGQVYEGVLVNVDNHYLYLQESDAFISSKEVTTKAFGNRFITTLVLFDLLAIALLA
jgi:small nuclear ribonucleoprotein (snRNP)-like protein